MTHDTITLDEYRAMLNMPAEAAQLTQDARKKQKRGTGPEQGIQQSILAYLQTRGILAWRINSGAIKTERGGLVKLAPKGHSDIAGVLNDGTGRALFIEVKQPGRTPTDEQRTFLDNVRAAGALAFVATSIDDVIVELERIDAEAQRRNAMQRVLCGATGLEETKP